MTTIVLASTLYGLATAVTVLDNELERHDDDRMLVVANNAPMAEIVPDLDQIEGFAALAGRFDKIVSFNALVAPYHPSVWRPADEDLAILRRLVRAEWGIREGPSRLLLESIQVRPAQTLAQLFPDCPITVYADGLMSYSPTRNRLHPAVFTRIERLVLPDLVPGVTPLLLGEYGVAMQTFPVEQLGKTLNEMSSMVSTSNESSLVNAPPRGEREVMALVIGQYLVPLGLLSRTDELELHLRMLAAARSHGATSVLFKPHPSSPPSLLLPMRRWASANRIAFSALSTRAPVETLLGRLRPAVMISAFSTALVTSQRLYGVSCLQVGARDLLKSLQPYENSNRIPLVIVEATVPDGESVEPGQLAAWCPLSVDGLNERIRAVGYLMQPDVRIDLRADAEAILAREGPRSLNVGRGRLTRLGLAGGYRASRLITRVVETAPGKMAVRAVRRGRRTGLRQAVTSLRR